MKRSVLFLLLTVMMVLALAAFSLPALADAADAMAALESLTIRGDDTGTKYVDVDDPDDVPVSISTKGDESLTIDVDVDNDYDVDIELDGDDVSDSSFDISGEHELEITITDGTDSYTFSIDISVAKATLKSLSIEGEDETYLKASSFSPGTFSYKISPVEDEDTLYLDLERQFEGDYVKVEYDSDDIDEDDGSFEIDLGSSLKTIKIYVESTGYADSIYKITLEEPEEGTLEDLYVNIGDEYDDDEDYELALLPEFDEDITAYTVLLPYEKNDDEVNVRASMSDADDYLTINGEEIDMTSKKPYGDVSLRIDPGDKEEVIIVAGSKTYTVTIGRAASKADDDDTLADISIQTTRGTTNSAKDTALDLSPKFSSGKYSYTVDVANKKDILYVYPEASDEDALIFVNGKLLTTSYYTLDLEEETELAVTVYSADYLESQTYNFDLGLGGAAALKSLSVYSSLGSVRFSPGFAAATLNYTGNVANDVSGVYLSLAAEGSNATIRVSLNDSSYSTVSGATQQYKLKEGLNSFAIQVVSGSKTATYYLYLYRQPEAPEIQVSSQKLSVNGGAAKQIAAYNINGNNFLKLRDVASLLSGTTKGFSVGFDLATNLVSLTKGAAYTAVGGELVIPGSYTRAVVSPQSVMLNNSNIYPMAYNIDGNNYFLLRDLALLFDFGIEFSSTQNLISIDTSESYSF